MSQQQHNRFFHHAAGAFPLDAASYVLDDDQVICEVVIGTCLHTVELSHTDAQRFAGAVFAADSHIRWPSGGLPRHGTLYSVETAADGSVLRVSWWWHTHDGLLSGADALAFLRSAGSLRPCAGCSQERMIYPELETPICAACGFYSQDGPGASMLLGGATSATQSPYTPSRHLGA